MFYISITDKNTDKYATLIHTRLNTNERNSIITTFHSGLDDAAKQRHELMPSYDTRSELPSGRSNGDDSSAFIPVNDELPSASLEKVSTLSPSPALSITRW